MPANPNRVEESSHGNTPYSYGACELCWAEAFTESRLHGGSQVDHYKRLLNENDNKPGHNAPG